LINYIVDIDWQNGVEINDFSEKVAVECGKAGMYKLSYLNMEIKTKFPKLVKLYDTQKIFFLFANKS